MRVNYSVCTMYVADRYGMCTGILVFLQKFSSLNYITLVNAIRVTIFNQILIHSPTNLSISIH